MLRRVTGTVLVLAGLFSAGIACAGWGDMSPIATGKPIFDHNGGIPQYCFNDTSDDPRYLVAAVQVNPSVSFLGGKVEMVSAQALPWEPHWISTVGVIWSTPGTWLDIAYAEYDLKSREALVYGLNEYGYGTEARCRVK